MTIGPLAEDLLGLLFARDRHAACRFSVDLVESGLSVAALIDEAFSPAMEELGRLWEAAALTAADQHAATTVAEAALSAASASAPRAALRGEVVVACVEGDCHTMPAQMVAEVLDHDGWAVRYLGAGVPQSDLLAYVGREAPAGIFFTCAFPPALPSILNVVDDLHDLGVAVYLGGRALGTSSKRAQALGVDGWAPSATGAPALLATTCERAVRPALGRLPAYRAMTGMSGAWVDQASDEVQSWLRAPAPFSAYLRAAPTSYLHDLVNAAGRAVLIDDATVFDETVGWMRTLLAARGFSETVIQTGLKALLVTAPAVKCAQDLLPLLRSALLPPLAPPLDAPSPLATR